MVVQELGWDEDVDDDLRMVIEDTIDADMVDGDHGNVVEAVLCGGAMTTATLSTGWSTA